MGKTDDSCPVCFKTFGSLVAEEEHGIAVESPAFAPETLGARQLPCKHYLCRKCVGEWLSSVSSRTFHFATTC